MYRGTASRRAMPLFARQLRVADGLRRGPRLFDGQMRAWLDNRHRSIVATLERQALARERVHRHLTDEVQESDAVRALEGGKESDELGRRLWGDNVSDWQWAEPAPGADYDDGDGSLKTLQRGVCALGCSECGGWWLRRVKPIRDLLKGGKLFYHCPNASCKRSSRDSREGPKMHVRKRTLVSDEVWAAR